MFDIQRRARLASRRDSVHQATGIRLIAARVIGEPTVDLRRRNADMTQEQLHVAEVCAAAQGMGRKRVTQGVRCDIGDISLVRVGLEDQPEALSRQPVSTMIEEERMLFSQHQARSRIFQVVAQGLDGGRPQRDATLTERPAGAA